MAGGAEVGRARKTIAIRSQNRMMRLMRLTPDPLDLPQTDQRYMTRRAEDWLRARGVRPTRQRIALAALMVGDGRDRHVTAEMLHSATQKAGKPVALATVYNTLHAFRDAGLLREIAVDGSKSYFDTRTDEHPHFFWEQSGRLTDAPTDSLSFERLPEPPPGTEIASVEVVIRLRARNAD